MSSELTSVVHDSELVRRRVAECQGKMVADRRRGRLLPFKDYQAEYDDVADLCLEFYEKLAELEGVPPSSLAGATVTVVSAKPEPKPAVRGDERKTGPYILEGRLGRGWSGEVFLAHKADLPEVKYAIKHFVSVGRSEYFDVLKREASVLAKLRGLASICQFVEFGVDRGVPFLVTSYVKGPTLEDCLANAPGTISDFPQHEENHVFDPDDPIAILPPPTPVAHDELPIDTPDAAPSAPATLMLPPAAANGHLGFAGRLRSGWSRAREAAGSRLQRLRRRKPDPAGTVDRIRDWIRFFELAARALGEAHRLGIVHRDLKPANVIINERGEPVVLDFGFALDSRDKFESLDGAGILVGTVSCMSPEQLMENYLPVDARTDVWSLGVCMYRVFTGYHPFAHGILSGAGPLRAADKGVLFGEIMVKETDLPRKLNHSIPRMLEQVILACLQKDRDRRYRDGNELAEDLRRIRQGYPILKDRVPLARRYVLQFKRKPERTLLVTIACAVLLIGGGWWLWRKIETVSGLKMPGQKLSAREIEREADAAIETTSHLVEEIRNLRKQKDDPSWDRGAAVQQYKKALDVLGAESGFGSKFIELRGPFMHSYKRWVVKHATEEKKFYEANIAVLNSLVTPEKPGELEKSEAALEEARHSSARARLQYELTRSDPPTYEGDQETEQADFKLRKLLRDALPELRNEASQLHAELKDPSLAQPSQVVVDSPLLDEHHQ